MAHSCDGCKFADWYKTASGRLHPNKGGMCRRLKEHPLDMRLPAAFYWHDKPSPSGGYVERGKPYDNPCIFKAGA